MKNGKTHFSQKYEINCTDIMHYASREKNASIKKVILDLINWI